jgi:peptide/nickel transport system substrate-binding protein
MQPVPQLASRWDEFLHNGQSVGWRFFLEPQARFWDGRPVTASDVVYSLKNAVVMTKLKPPNPDVEALDPHTLVIKYGPLRPLLHALPVAFIVPERLYEEQDVEQMPMGSGPFQLETRTPDRIVLRRFDNYYGTKPLQKKIAYLVVPDKMKHPGLCKSGVVDATDDPPNQEFIDALNKANIPVVTAPGAMVFVVFDARQSALADPQVRRALSLALNRPMLAERFQALPIEFLPPPGMAEPDREIAWHAFDPEQARSLLTTVQVPTVKLWAYPAVRPYAEAVAEAWRSVGVTVENMVVETPQVLREFLKKDLQGAYITRRRNVWDVDTVLSDYIESAGALSLYKNAEADKLIEVIRHEIYPEKVTSLYRSLVQILKEDPPLIPLLRERQFYGVRGGWQPRADGLMLGVEVGPDR